MAIKIYAYFDQYTKASSNICIVMGLRDILNDKAIEEQRYTLDTVLTHFPGLEGDVIQGYGDYCVFFTLNPDIVSFIESWPYTSHIIILDDLSACPALFSGWEQFPSTDGSQEWRPADWKRTEITVLVTTRERLVENVIAFLKREGLSFKEGQ